MSAYDFLISLQLSYYSNFVLSFDTVLAFDAVFCYNEIAKFRTYQLMDSDYNTTYKLHMFGPVS
jgi:hypothetical protein